MKRIWTEVLIIITLLLFFILTIGVAGCQQGSQENRKDRENGKTVINLEGGDWGYPTPFAHYTRGPGIYKMTLLFDSLLERGEKGYIPWLAEKWFISEDGLTYTFTLREKLKWHDGRPLTAEDVKFSFDYYKKHPPIFNDLTVDGNPFIRSVTVVDEKTVRVQVEKPLATLLGKIGTARVIPKHIWEKVNDPRKFVGKEAVIGSGPYVLKEYNKEQGAYQYEAFRDFWGPKPRVDLLQFIPVSDSLLAFEKGEIDLTEIPPDALARYQNQKEYKIMRNPPFWGYRLIFNMNKRPELKEKKVRQAIAYAIDREELVEKVARGAAVPGNAGFLPVSHRWFNSAAKSNPFDPEKARQLLEEKSLSFTLLTGNTNAEVRIAELLRLSLAKAGMDLKIESIDQKSLDDAIRQENYELVLNGHGGWGNDADQLRTIYSNETTSDKSPYAGGLSGYQNDQINRLCNAQLYEMNEEKRKEIIFQLQALIAEEVPQIPLYNTTGYIVFRPSKYDGWKYMFDHHDVTHNKLSYLDVTP